MGNIFLEMDINKCVGCTACEALCPKKVIKIKKDALGFLKPSMNGKCINCGICTKACPCLNNRPLFYEPRECFSASAKDETILKNSSSGGISNLLMEHLLENGYTIIGCFYDADKEEAIHTVATSSDELNQFYGSKYFQSDFKNAVQFVKNNRDIKIAVFGLPCQIKSIRLLSQYLKINSDNLFLVSLMCYGVASPLLWKKYLEEIVKRKIKDRIIDVKFRSKHYGWHRSTFEFLTLKAKYVAAPIGNEFLDLFYSRYFMNEACYSCNIRNHFDYEDMRIGDFWGELYKDNQSGKSGVIICTQIGKTVFENIKKDLDCEAVNINLFLDSQSLIISEKHSKEQREEIRLMFVEKGIVKTSSYVKSNQLKAIERFRNFLWIAKRKLINKEKKFRKIFYE